MSLTNNSYSSIYSILAAISLFTAIPGFGYIWASSHDKLGGDYSISSSLAHGQKEAMIVFLIIALIFIILVYINSFKNFTFGKSFLSVGATTLVLLVISLMWVTPFTDKKGVYDEKMKTPHIIIAYFNFTLALVLIFVSYYFLSKENITAKVKTITVVFSVIALFFYIALLVIAAIVSSKKNMDYITSHQDIGHGLGYIFDGSEIGLITSFAISFVLVGFYSKNSQSSSLLEQDLDSGYSIE